MALQYLTVSPESNQSKGEVVLESVQELDAAANGNTILAADQIGRMKTILLSLIVTAGSGKIQYTISNRADVIAGNEVWYDWNAGVVIANTTDVLFFVSAVRVVNVTGTTKIEVRVI